MDTYIGRGGNQLSHIFDKSVAPIHCCISDEGDDYFSIIPLNYRPTFINGRRISCPETVEGDDIIKIGDSFEKSVAEAYAERFDPHVMTDWGLAAERCGDWNAAEGFNNVTMGEYEDYDFMDAVLMCAEAYYLMQMGKLRMAQERLYEAGDEIYRQQDGSALKYGAYAGVFGLLAELYIRAGRRDVAQQALNGAEQMLSMGAECSSLVCRQIALVKAVFKGEDEFPVIEEKEVVTADKVLTEVPDGVFRGECPDLVDLSGFADVREIQPPFFFRAKAAILPPNLEVIGDGCLGSIDYLYAPASLKKVGSAYRVGFNTTSPRFLSLKGLDQCVLNVDAEFKEKYEALAQREGIGSNKLIINELPYDKRYFYTF